MGANNDIGLGNMVRPVTNTVMAPCSPTAGPRAGSAWTAAFWIMVPVLLCSIAGGQFIMCTLLPVASKLLLAVSFDFEGCY